MTRRRTRGAFLGALSVFGSQFNGSATGPASAAPTYTLRLSMAQSVTSMLATAALRFASAVGRRSNGAVTIEVYPDGQLAQEQETIDGLVTGVIDFSIESSAFLLSRFPQYQVFDAPFLFKDVATAYRVLDGSIGSELFAELEPKGIVGLGWATQGFRELETTSKPVSTPEDLKGLRMRIAGGGVFVAMYQALGAIPVTINPNETLMALSQHAADGIDYNLDGFSSGKFYTVVKHVAMTNHSILLQPLLGSKRKIESLPLALQRIVKEEGKAATSFMRSLVPRQTAAAIRFLKQNGVLFTDIQYPAFRKAVDPVYATLQSKLGGNLLDRISRAANSV
jgi:TRAP-type transport system periplasmic protein